jgi:hypothetical protein
MPTAGQNFVSSPPPTPDDDHSNWKSVLAHPPNTMMLEFHVELLLADSAMRAAPTEGNGADMAENLNVEN